MTCVNDLTKAFQEKLERTGSFDAAFTKAVWNAYKQGLKDGSEAAPVDLAAPKWATPPPSSAPARWRRLE